MLSGSPNPAAPFYRSQFCSQQIALISSSTSTDAIHYVSEIFREKIDNRRENISLNLNQLQNLKPQTH